MQFSSNFMSLSSKNTKNKNIRSNKIKKKSNKKLASWDFKSQVDNLNFDQILGG